MQFHVPQFIDNEDTIMGPITVRQFIILLVCALFLFLEFKLSDMTLFIVEAVPTIIVFAVFAFFKVNTLPFHSFLIILIETLKRPKIRTWGRVVITTIAQLHDKAVKEKEAAVVIHKPLVSQSRLQDLSLLIDTGGQWQPATFNQNYGSKSK